MSYRLNIYVSYPLKSWWKKKAAKNNRSLSGEIRNLMEEIKNEEENKEQLKKTK